MLQFVELNFDCCQCKIYRNSQSIKTNDIPVENRAGVIKVVNYFDKNCELESGTTYARVNWCNMHNNGTFYMIHFDGSNIHVEDYDYGIDDCAFGITATTSFPTGKCLGNVALYPILEKEAWRDFNGLHLR